MDTSTLADYTVDNIVKMVHKEVFAVDEKERLYVQKLILEALREDSQFPAQQTVFSISGQTRVCVFHYDFDQIDLLLVLPQVATFLEYCH